MRAFLAAAVAWPTKTGGVRTQRSARPRASKSKTHARRDALAPVVLSPRVATREPCVGNKPRRARWGRCAGAALAAGRLATDVGLDDRSDRFEQQRMARVVRVLTVPGVQCGGEAEGGVRERVKDVDVA